MKGVCKQHAKVTKNVVEFMNEFEIKKFVGKSQLEGALLLNAIYEFSENEWKISCCRILQL